MYLGKYICGCQTKISNLHIVMGVKENIDGLQVSVNHALQEHQGMYYLQ